MADPRPQQEARRRFHEELATLEDDIHRCGELAERALTRAMEALMERDPAKADEVIAGDDELDELYISVERRWLEVMALQTPVATDLRLMSVILHVNFHLERIGDMAVNIAKMSQLTRHLPTNPTILSHLQEMADVVRPMIRAAMEAFARRDLQLALRLPDMDEPVDRLNRGMYREVAACGLEHDLIEWAAAMMVVSRQLERVGDHAVDVAEQVAFLLTGEFREFTDASHPGAEDDE
ncbi:MAG TPA: phosphate signaling complex protein PhoU [Actinomycetota bacterium]|jgi:phosphate transport system protein|nr:phosphate signaling complex protein PhoU [Actinomycetota bacterium]